jgi:hypothetical protein
MLYALHLYDSHETLSNTLIDNVAWIQLDHIAFC